jgi:ABC-type uncharacterized transport system permease subunit
MSLLTIILYLLVVIFYNKKSIILILGGFAISLHAILLYQSIVTPSGLNFGFFNAASMMVWMIALLLLTTIKHRVENLILVIFPIAAITIGVETYFHTEYILAPNQALGVSFHILSSIIAYSLLNISALQAIFLAFQDYQLRHKHPISVIKALPPLQVMEKLLYQMIALGLIWLSLSLITGVVFIENLFAQHLVHKTILSVIAWSVFAILLWGHFSYGWRGKTTIRWTLIGFAVLMLGYFGSKLVLEFILHR